MKKIIRITETNLVKLIKGIINEGCEDGSCIPNPSNPDRGSGWSNLEKQSFDSYEEYLRRKEDMDTDLFDELYDETSDNAYFSFEDFKKWWDKDGNQLNENQSKIISSFPVTEKINSWEEWVNSQWFNTTYLAFSKRATKNSITINKGKQQKPIRWNEEPMERKRMYFEQYLSSFGTFLVKQPIDRNI